MNRLPAASQVSSNIDTRNIDSGEIAKFEAIAGSWWDPDGEFKPLHQMNPLRLTYIMDNASGLFGKTVLDVGCGGGLLSEAMAREGAKVTGLDMAAEPLEIARLHALENGVSVSYLQQTAEQHAAQNPATYDVVSCMELLEHVPDPCSVVQACTRLVKPGGHVFFSTVNRNIKSWLMVIVAAEYLLRLLPKGTHQLSKFIKPAELISWMDNSSLQTRHINGMRYNPLTQGFSLVNDVSVNYILHAQALN